MEKERQIELLWDIIDLQRKELKESAEALKAAEACHDALLKKREEVWQMYLEEKALSEGLRKRIDEVQEELNGEREKYRLLWAARNPEVREEAEAHGEED